MFDKQIAVLQRKLQSLSTVSIGADRHQARVPSIVGVDMAIRGELIGAGDLQVEGKVFGNIDAGHLFIADGGSVEGNVVAQAVGISGVFIGSLKANTVTLSSTAKVRGEILHNVLVIEAGAELDGQCRRISPGPKDVLLSAPERPAAP